MMNSNILNQLRESLDRQHKGLQLLYSLLREEFDNLISRDKSRLARQELAVQELMRQLAREKQDLSMLCQQALAERGLSAASSPVSSFLAALPEELGRPLLVKIKELKQQEQACANQATVNADLVMGLLAQSRELIDFLQKTITDGLPKDTYTRQGGFQTTQCPPVAIRGRF